MPKPAFSVLEKGHWPLTKAGAFSLLVDQWDDYHFKTLFTLHYGTGDDSIEIGAVKIATKGMQPHSPHTKPPGSFHKLDDSYFSVGQDREYYENLSKLPGKIGRAVLDALRDVAASDAILQQIENEDVFSTSLLRSVPLPTVTTQFRRIIAGKPALTEYAFNYSGAASSSNEISLDFEVVPYKFPPSNTHVIIGANGVGKSHLLRDFVTASSAPDQTTSIFTDQTSANRPDTSAPFSNVVHITFSAFDSAPQASVSAQAKIGVHVIGLPRDQNESLGLQFYEAAKTSLQGRRRTRWLEAYNTLARSDTLINESRLPELIDPLDEAFDATSARELFESMSSGHKIALLTVTRLVELVEERSLVLLDEPETHLHPPLLSALIRAISDLAIDRNAVTIIATHSPVVLQEVPRSCVWRLQRSGDNIRGERPLNETFGESVSRLTTDVFHLDVTQTGYTALLYNLLKEKCGSASAVLSELGQQLGSEGQYILSALSSRFRGDDV